MPTTYLGGTVLNLPSVIANGHAIVPRTMEWMRNDIVGELTNPFTGQQQTQYWGAGPREVSFTFQSMSNAQALAFVAWMESLQGILNLFQLGDPLNTSTQGTITGTYIVNGANQTGFSLITSGGSGLQVADWIQVNVPSMSIGYLYRVTSLSGGTLGLYPSLRVSPNNGDTVIVSNTTGLWRLKENSGKHSVRETKMYGISIDAREAY
jgi:hypothetical protein